jgi:AraC-like DNA-binding protein
MPNWTIEGLSGLATDYPAGNIIKAHQHADHHQIVHAEDGIFRVSSDAASWVVPPGRAIWMPAARMHSIQCYTPVKMRTLYLHRSIDIGMDDCSVWSVSALMREIIVRLAEDSCRGMEQHLISLLFSEIETLNTLPLKLPQPKDERLCRITDTISRHPADKRSLEDWASQLGFSKRNLIRRFQIETGMTFRQWRRQSRLLSSLERLANNEPVTRIALELGYESPSAFSAAFRDTFGVTPRQYFTKP